jgi:hypothetical protein
MWAMQWFLAQYGPDSVFGWLLLVFVAYAPLLVLGALVLTLVVAIARRTIFRAPPSEMAAPASVAPADPEATAAYLSERARDRRADSRGSDQAG